MEKSESLKTGGSVFFTGKNQEHKFAHKLALILK